MDGGNPAAPVTPLQRAVELALAASLHGMDEAEYDAWRSGGRVAIEDAARNVLAVIGRRIGRAALPEFGAGESRR